MSVAAPANQLAPLPIEKVTSLSSEKTATIGLDDVDLSGCDEEQIRLMNEMCIVVDENDKPIGIGTKKACHLMDNIEKGLLHRAFSVFLFDHDNRLLLQQRASEKVTFPDLWTNTCCSHPLAVAGEMGVDLPSSIEGAQRAAQRKLSHELGIPEDEVPLGEFEFLTRVHYLAASDGKWGEHEIDYILFLKPTRGSVTLDVNPNEVRDTTWVSSTELREMLEDPALKFTPWFKLICESMLFQWWEHLDRGLERFKEEDIRRM